MQLNELLIV